MQPVDRSFLCSPPSSPQFSNRVYLSQQRCRSAAVRSSLSFDTAKRADGLFEACGPQASGHVRDDWRAKTKTQHRKALPFGGGNRFCCHLVRASAMHLKSLFLLPGTPGGVGPDSAGSRRHGGRGTGRGHLIFVLHSVRSALNWAAGGLCSGTNPVDNSKRFWFDYRKNET